MVDGTTDDLKGRTKEAAGDLTDDQSRKYEGKVDRATGSVKDAAMTRATSSRTSPTAAVRLAVSMRLSVTSDAEGSFRPGGELTLFEAVGRVA